MLLTGKTAIVTGGSRGIGHAIAVAFAEAGANVAIIYAGNTAAAEETLKEVQAKGAQGVTIQCDVSDEAAVTAMIKAVKDQFGAIDILVNNAGIIDTNLTGTYYCIKGVTKIMMKQRHGSIINLSSVVGETGNAGQANYAAAKAGILGLTKAVAKELASRSIRCNAVAPGYIQTDMTADLPESVIDETVKSIPLGRVAQPEEVAQTVLFLASDNASYITGQVLNVDGGMVM